MIARRAAAAFAVALALAAPLTAAAGDATTRALQALTAMDLRVASIGDRLAIAALPFCPTRSTRRPGFVYQDASQYRADVRIAAIALYGLGDGPAVSAVVPGGAADRAGLRAGDALRTLNGAGLTASARPTRNAASEDRMTALAAQFAAAFAAGPAHLGITRGGAPMTVVVAGTPGCATDFQMELADKVNAGADGTTVTVTRGTLLFAGSDDPALAFVLAHELAHDILGHRDALDEAHVSRGLLRAFGRNRRLIRETEEQADYLGVYICAAAGYDLDAIVPFWRRMAKEHGLGPFSDGTHLGDGDRIAFLTAAIAEVRAAQAAGETLTPDYPRFAAAHAAS